MKNKYEIIKDIDELERFVKWLPDLKDHEKFYVALFARKKYDTLLQSTSSDKMQLKRLLATKDNLIDKIKQLEIEIGLYKLKQTEATQQSLAIYITPNPRCMIKAHNDVLLRVAKAITTGNYFYNLHAETMSCIQRSKAKTHWIDFDIDTKEVDISKIQDILNFDSYKILETRGGYHILVNPEKVTPQTKWYKLIQNTFKIDRSGDQLIPIPGCTQGNFVPKFIEL